MFRASTKNTLKTRREMKLSELCGMDFTSDATQVALHRASGGKNFIMKNGTPHKRNGWLQIANTTDRINGIFEYAEGIYVVHAGTHLYKLTTTESGEYTVTQIGKRGGFGGSLENDRSMAFKNGNRLFILGCGNYVYVEIDELCSSWDYVNGSDIAYIPTTTITIDSDDVTEKHVAFLDDVNILQPLVKNTLVGSAANKTWTLDGGKIKNDTAVKITAQILTGDTINDYEMATSNSGTTIYYIKKNGVDYGGINSSTQYVCGTIDRSNGKITFSIATTPPGSGANIEVTYNPGYEDKSARVTECGMATLFGIGGRSDRLFVAGTGEYKNLQFYSEAGDYTYFSDRSAMALGSDSSAITGQLRLSDATLAVFKNNGAGNEATVYYINGDTMTDGDGIVKTIFTVTAGSSGESCISPYTTADLRGDSIMLTESGVYGVAMTSSVTKDRGIYCRSENITAKLRQITDKSNAISTVYDGKYYLSFGEDCYIADADYVFTGRSGNKNYEWFYFDNIPARVFANINGALGFGTADGKICVFDSEYSDRTIQQITPGLLTVTITNQSDNFDKFTYTADDLEISNGDLIKFNCEGMYGVLCGISWNSEDEHDTFRYSKYGTDSKITEGIQGQFRAGLHDFSFVTSDRLYSIEEIDRGRQTVKMRDTISGLLVETAPDCIDTRSNRFFTDITDRTLYVVQKDGTDFAVSFLDGGDAIDIGKYGDTLPISITGVVIHKRNVVAEWYTNMTDCGSNTTAKTLIGMTLCAKSAKHGRITFGYETRRVEKNTYSARGISEFDFDNQNYTDYSFETGFASSFTVRCNERNFNYIIFRIRSDDGGDCSIVNFTFCYKYNTRNTGVN